jgi:signal transduction histidine kinase
MSEQRLGSEPGILRIEVEDTGPGISEEGVNSLFKKFSQVSNSQNERQTGTGLGLWITHRIVTKMGGRIKAKSAIGVGTSFILKIPTETATIESRRELTPFKRALS